MQKRKDVLTTGQVAQICKVAPRTVTKWFDSGQLKGYRIPGSKDRRIPTTELIRFMKIHDMPTDELEMGKMRVLIIDSNWEAADAMAAALRTRPNYEVQTTNNSFDAGLIAQKLIPHVILINLMSRDIDAAQVCKFIRASEDLSTAKIIAVAEGLNGNETSALIAKGFDAVLGDPNDYLAAIDSIQHLTAIIY